VEALTAAFDRAGLEQLLAFELDEDLDRIAGDGPLPDVVFDLVRWAERQGRVLELVAAGRAANPGNDEVQAVANELQPPPAPKLDLSEWVSIHDQGVAGTAVAMATVAAMEAALARKGRSVRLSARYLFQKARQYDGLPPSAEGSYLDSILYVAQFFGVPAEDVWPYIAGDPDLPEGKTWEDVEREERTKAVAYRLGSLQDIPFHLGAGRPIVAAVPIYQRAWMAEETGRTGIIGDDFDVLVGMHAILIVGHDPADGNLRFANSWGTGWGDGGFGTLTAAVRDKLVDHSDGELVMHAIDAG
jgi:hypothetical protein